MLIRPELSQGPAAARATGRPALPLVRVTFGLVNRVALMIDGVMALLAAVVAAALAPGLLGPLQVVILGGASALAFTAALRALRAYRAERYRRPACVLVDVGRGWAAAAAGGGLLLLAFAPQAFETALPQRWLAATFLAVAAGRAATALLLARIEAAGLLRRRTAVIGANALGAAVMRRLGEGKAVRDFELVGLFDDAPQLAPTDLAAGGATAGSVHDLCLLAQKTHIDLILIALSWDHSRRILELTEQVQWISADVAAPIENPGVLEQSSLLSRIAGIPVIPLIHHPFKGTEGLVKAAEDYLVAALAVVALSPVMLACALAVRLEGGGPALFRQARMGINGRLFHIYKFRTMRHDPADDGSHGAVRGDPRVTRTGAFLRRTSLDELPQLFNVLKGEMSIVGPRPHVPNMLIGQGAYVDTVRAYAARHRIKPGITGWAQINGMRGGIDTVAKARQGVELDLFYMQNWSVAFDLRIILRTLTSHLAGPAVF